METENGNMAIGSWKPREIFVSKLKYETKTHQTWLQAQE